MNLREATIDDIPVLAEHHRKMFEEIYQQKGEYLEPAIAEKIEEAYALKLENEFVTGVCKGYAIEVGGRIVASGGVTFVSSVPNPRDLTCRAAYLHSMYTEKAYRNKMYAPRIIEKIIEYCKSRKIKSITLTASSAGEPIYEKIGFRPSPNSMRLLID